MNVQVISSTNSEDGPEAAESPEESSSEPTVAEESDTGDQATVDQASADTNDGNT